MWLASVAIAVCAMAQAGGPLRAQADPRALQARAIQRIDAFVAHFRQTGEFQSRVADLAQADAELAASNQALTARGDWSTLATGLIKRGAVHRMQGDWATAVGLYRQAVSAAERVKDVVKQADALAWAAFSESSRRDRNLGQAAADAARAVRLAEPAGDADVLARALDVLGIVQIAQTDFAGAADTVNREVAVAARAADPTAPYYALLNRADIYQKIGDRCDVERGALDPCYEAYDRSRADYEQAAGIATRLGYPGMAAQVRDFVEGLEQRRAMLEGKEKVSRAFADSRIFHPRTLADVLVTERFVPPPEDSQELAALVQDVQRMRQTLVAFGQTSEPLMDNTEGLMHEMRGNHDAALASFLRAIAALDRDRRGLRDERRRGTFLEDRIGFYYAAIQQLLEHRRHGEAFEVFERARARSLADLLASRPPELEASREQQLFADLMVLRTKIADAQSRLFEIASDADRTNDRQLPAAEQQIRALESQHDALTARIAAEAPKLETLVASKPATLAAFQQLLRAERSEALQYLVLTHAVLVWHITPDGVTVKNVFLPRREVISKMDALRKSLADPRTAFDATTSRELFLYLVAPVLRQVRSDRLIILPHEDLYYLPFQALQDPADQRYLGERFQIIYAPSASILLQLPPSPGLANGRVLAVADPSIPAAVDEVAAVARLFPGRSRVISDALARERDVKTAIGEHDVIHLAVHGKFDGAQPLLSYLTLARGAGDDGRLTAAEMFGLALTKSRLVILSACETGRAEATQANELLGIVRALIYAGAGTLVLSHWEVDSEATARWMTTFYEAGRSRPLPEAARAALQAVKSVPEYRHPYYWAAFTMVGR